VDIPDLAKLFLEAACERFGRRDIKSLSQKALIALLRHDWTTDGNIRGLEHTLNRSVLLAPPRTARLEAQHIEFDEPFDFGRTERRATTPATPADTGSEPIPPQPPRKAIPSPARRISEAQIELQELFQRKIPQYGAHLGSMAADPEILAAFGGARGRASMPVSSLRLRLRRLGMDTLLEAERSRRRDEMGLDVVREAIVLHGSGSAAANALGVTREALVWQLRKAGLTIRDILEDR
jgi:DNA-binding NtrC family response regulator